MADEMHKRVLETIDYLDQMVAGPEVSELDAVKLFMLSLMSEYLKGKDYYSVLGLFQDMKDEWTRLNSDKVERKQIADDQNN